MTEEKTLPPDEENKILREWIEHAWEMIKAQRSYLQHRHLFDGPARTAIENMYQAYMQFMKKLGFEEKEIVVPNEIK